MFGPEWQEGCPGCSLLCDQVDGARQHFEHNDVSFVAVSRGPLDKLQAYRKRMGWSFRWVSSAESDFNFDYHVSFPKGARETGVFYNFDRPARPGSRRAAGRQRLLQGRGRRDLPYLFELWPRRRDVPAGVYDWLDIAPKGRNETKSGEHADWMKRHDRYEDDGRTRRA